MISVAWMGEDYIRCLGLNLACEYVPGVGKLVLVEREMLYSRAYTDATLALLYSVRYERKPKRTAIWAHLCFQRVILVRCR